MAYLFCCGGWRASVLPDTIEHPLNAVAIFVSAIVANDCGLANRFRRRASGRRCGRRRSFCSREDALASMREYSA